jgi:putative Holliday junction resolvase
MKTRIVALDYGSARIGIALSDERKILASPLTVFECPKQKTSTPLKLFEFLTDHAKKGGYEIEKIVVGLPLLMSGQKGDQAEEVLFFIKQLSKLTPSPIVTFDERLTTRQAETVMKEGAVSRKNRAKAADQLAAVIILQNYLEKGLN